jgi:hypothetical protein
MAVVAVANRAMTARGGTGAIFRRADRKGPRPGLRRRGRERSLAEGAHRHRRPDQQPRQYTVRPIDVGTENLFRLQRPSRSRLQSRLPGAAHAESVVGTYGAPAGRPLRPVGRGDRADGFAKDGLLRRRAAPPTNCPQRDDGLPRARIFARPSICAEAPSKGLSYPRNCA